MELGSADVLTGFKPIFNRGRGVLDPSSPHARNAALLPFLLHVHVSESGHLQVLTSDFHSNTWHARFSHDHLQDLKETLGFKESFSAFLQGLHGAFASSEVKIELGGPASAVGGKGATSAKLKANFDMLGTSRDLSLILELFKGRSANDAVGALALDLYDAFIAAQRRNSELEANIKDEQQRSSSVLNAILQGKADSIHFRSSTLPNMAQNEVRLPWTDVQSLSILMPTQSSISMNSYLSPSLTSSIPPGYIVYPPVYPAAPAAKPYKSLVGAGQKKRGVSRNSALKLSEENSYSRAAKTAEKRVESIIDSDVGDNEVLPEAQTYDATGCSGGPNALDSGSEKRKYRDLDADLLAKIESGGENRSAKTDAWARRHYSEWRKSHGLPEREIEELPLSEFSESLVKFFCMVKKHNGDLFPSESLKAMYRAFVRIIQSHYKKLSMHESYSGPVIDAGKDILFEKARLACVEAMKHSLLQGANQSKRKKVDEVLPVPTEDILACPNNQISTPQGLSRRLCYYAIHKFCINGNMELYDTTDIEFRRVVNEQGDIFWEYDEKRAEKYKRKGMFRAVVECNDKDVVECLDKYFMHLPPKPLEEEPRRLFLAPIRRPTSNVWFRHQNISSRTLLEWYRYMGPPALDQADAIKNQVGHSRCSLRDVGTSDEKEVSSGTTVNLPAMGTGGGHMREAKKTPGHETFGKIVDVPSDTDEDNAEPNIGDDPNELTDVDSHEEGNVEPRMNSSSADMDEITI